MLNLITYVSVKTTFKVEKILKGSLDSISSPSRSCEHLNFLFSFFFGQTLLSIVNKLCWTKSLLTMPSNVLSLCLKPIIWIFTKGEGEGIKSRLPFKILPNFNDDLEVVYFIVLVISFYVQKNEYFFCSNHSL